MGVPSRAVASLVIAAGCWGLGTVIAKRAVAEFAPISLLAAQLASSLAVLLILMRWRSVPFRDPAAPPVLLRLGLLNPGIAYALSLVGLVSITASLSVLLWALEPILILLLATIFLGERIGPLGLGLSAMAIAGIWLIAGDPQGEAAAVGIGLTIAGVVCCAAYTIATRRWIGASDSTAQVVLGQQAHALGLALALAVVTAIVAGGVLPTGATATGWLSAVGSGLLYYAAAYWFYLSGLRDVPASIAAAAFYLIPAFGVAGGVILLGETLDPRQWLGVAVVAAAIAGLFWRTLAGKERRDGQRPAVRQVRA
jgi:drug/metabolite transporter (DMT)-like permease